MTVIPRSERYSPTEVAQVLGVHVASVWRWMQHGVRGRKLGATMIGGRRYILVSDLATFLNRASATPSESNADLRRRALGAGKLLDARGVKTRMVGSNP